MHGAGRRRRRAPRPAERAAAPSAAAPSAAPPSEATTSPSIEDPVAVGIRPRMIGPEAPGLRPRALASRPPSRVQSDSIQVMASLLVSQLRVVGVRADESRAVGSDEHLILELHAEGRSRLARVALEAQHHVLLELALRHDATRAAVVVGVRDAGPLVLEA